MKARRSLSAGALCALVSFSAGLFAGPGARAQDVYHDNVVIILDASGSMDARMRGTSMRKIDAAKSALKEVMKRVPETTHIGLLVFSGRSRGRDWSYPLGPRDKARLDSAIGAARPSGGTPLGRYIKKGADRLLEERRKQLGYGTYRLLVVTDGEADDVSLVEKYTPDVVARGITVDVIGVDMNARHTLATKVHSYRSANDPSSLKKAIAEVFAEISAGGGGAAEDEEAFEVLAPIPAALAGAMIKALSTSGNHPIGAKPALARRGTGRARPVAGSKGPPGAAPSSGKGVVSGTTIFIVVILAVLVTGAIAKRKSGGSSRKGWGNG